MLIFLVSVVDSKASQNLEDWEFSLNHVPNDLIQLFQLSTLKQRAWDEAETFERCIQPCPELDLQQLLLTSLKSLQPNVKVLVFILEAEAMLIRGHQVVFEGYF